MKIKTNDFWRRVDQMVKEKNVTLKGFCASIGVAHSTFSNQRTYSVLPPKIEQVAAMAKYLDVTIDFLLYGNEENDPILKEYKGTETFRRLVDKCYACNQDQRQVLETMIDSWKVPYYPPNIREAGLA